MWNDLVKTALIGTDKKTPSVETLENVQNWGIKSDEITEIILEAAGISAMMQKAGYVLNTYEAALPTPAEKDEGAFCSPKSALHLKKILADGNEGLLSEFLFLLQKHNKRLPPEFLPEVLHLARGNKPLQAIFAQFIGKRGVWLIQQNQDWAQFNISETTTLAAPPQLNQQETLEEARQILDIFRTNRALWAEESVLIQQLKDFALKAEPALADKLELFFEEDLPYYWQQRIRQMNGTLYFRKQMADEMGK